MTLEKCIHFFFKNITELGLDQDDLFEMKVLETRTNVTVVSETKVEEEEIDIDLDDPDVANAATKIQAGFRGSQARKEVKAMRQDAVVDENIEDDTKKEIEVQLPVQEESEAASPSAGEEEIDIDLDDPEVNAAATKIQAGFKGKKARDEVRKMKEDKDDDKHETVATPDIQVSELPTSSIPTIEIIDDQKPEATEEELDEAATIIQSGYYDMKLREEEEIQKTSQNVEEEEVIDIDLNDPEVNQAATKIQAGFKGKKARDEVKKMKEEKETVDKTKPEGKDEDEEIIDIDLEDPEVNAAATKIQAGFKGKKARDEVKKMKEEKESPEEGGETDKPEEEVKEKETEEEIDIDLDDPEVNEAATKIQASFKGKKARDEVKKMKDDKEEKEQEGQTESEEPAAEKETQEEEIDIDLDDPEVNEAATKIQAGFKGKKARDEVKKMKEEKEAGETEGGESEEADKKAKEDITEKETEEEIDIDLDDPEVNEAATKIQASFKGKKARDEVKKMKEEKEQGGEAKEETAEVIEQTAEDGAQPEEEEIDIDLEDPEVNAAATKIQAGFKGKKARDEVKEMKKMKEQYVDERAVFLSKPASAEEQKAASKIQAGFKGMRTRKKMKKRKALGNDILV